MQVDFNTQREKHMLSICFKHNSLSNLMISISFEAERHEFGGILMGRGWQIDFNL
jgi:hypothetical protein